ncbi:MAG: tetratricopeptide repeat protein, partial [Planctomycetia bacterium]|nr:tetratricopeptide repeat protein [Planctomycetia bacterium]
MKNIVARPTDGGLHNYRYLCSNVRTSILRTRQRCFRGVRFVLFLCLLPGLLCLSGCSGQRVNIPLEIESGINALTENNPQQALVHFETILTASPRNVQALQGAGEACIRLRDYTKANKYLSDAINVKPDSSELRTKRGETWLGLGKYADAIADFDLALKATPDATMTRANRGY